VSLYQLIPAGSGKALSLLRRIVDYILTNKPSRKPSILIAGNQGIRTHARALMRALGIEDAKEMEGILIQQCGSLIEYFRNSTSDSGYIIAGSHQLDPRIQVHVIDILNNRKFNLFNFVKESKEIHQVDGILVLTAPSVQSVPETIRRVTDYLVEIEPYNFQQKILVALQRLRYCGIGYQGEDVLKEIVLRADGNLRRMVQIMQVGITLISTEGRTELGVKDIRKGADMLPPPIQSKS
jgi:hypothetical protein